MTTANHNHTPEPPPSNWRAWLYPRRWPLAVGLALALAAATLLAFLFGRAWWPPVVLLLITLPYGIVLAFLRLSRTGEEEFLRHGVGALAAVLMALLLAALGLWLLVNFFWATADGLPVSDSLTLSGDSGGAAWSAQVEVAYPHVVLLNDPRAAPPNGETALILRFTPAAAIDPPVAIAARVPAGLRGRWDGAPPLLGAAQTTATLTLRNDGARLGLRPAGNITLDAAAPATADAALALPIVIEGQRGFAVRNFVNSTVNQASPLILLLVLVVPGAAALVQRAIDRRAGELRRQHRRQFAQHRKRFREHFLAGEWEKAGAKIDEMAQSRYEAFNGEDVAIGRRFLALAQPQAGPDGAPPPQPDVGVIEIAGEWPEGYAVAYEAAWQRLRGETDEARRAYDHFFRQARLRVEDLPLAAAPHLQRRLALAVSEQRVRAAMGGGGAFDVQSRLWPPKAEAPELASPFAFDDATQKREADFLTTGAYESPEWFGAFCRVRDSAAVYGPPGSGRTALAAMLWAGSGADILGARLSGRPQPAQMARELVLAQLRFLVAHPVLRDALDRGQQALLAGLLVEHLGERYTLAAIDQEQTSLNATHDLKSDADRAFAYYQLQAFKGDVQRAAERRANLTPPAVNVASPDAWLADAVQSAFSLGFKRVYCVVDGGADAAAWLAATVLPHWDVWRGQRLRLILLLPEAGLAALAGLGPTYGGLAPRRLAWTPAQLAAMVERRLKTADGDRLRTGRYRKWRDYVGLVTTHAHVAGQPNPRQLVRIFQEMERAATDERAPFTSQDAARAVAQLGLEPLNQPAAGEGEP